MTRTQGFDALGRVVEVGNPDGWVETMAYNKRDEQVAFKDGNDVTTTFVRNGFGEVIQEVSPDRGTSIYIYDAAGRMASATDGRGQQIDYAYDIAGRLLAKTPVGRPAGETFAYAYDSGTFGLGRLASVSDGTGVTQFGYDHRGNLTQRTQSVGSTTAASLSYTYDLADRIVEIGYPSGREVRYNRDAKGRVSGVETRASSVAAWTGVASGLAYQPFGAVESMSLTNGLAVTNERGLDGRLRARRLTNASSSATAIGTKYSDLSYVHDPDGNVASIDDAVVPARSAIYGYDTMGRMNMMVAEGAATNASYTTTTGTNRLASITASTGTRSIAYDARGNPISEARPGSQSVTIAYDGHGRMTGYARSGEVSLTHVYNGMDDRVSTTSVIGGNSDTRRFVYASDGRVMGEYGTSASDVKAEFIWASPEVGDAGMFGGDDGLGGYMPLVVAANDNFGVSQLSWVHGNHMGVPTVIADVTGTELSFPTGYALPGFPGQSRTLADLYYNRYRDYDPTTGRYIQADPIGLAGGASPYSYAMNNPLRYTDPTGEFVPLLVGVVIGAGLEYLTNKCASASDIILAGVLGGVGGGFGGKALTKGLGGLSNKTKGKIGEALSNGYNRARGSRRVDQDFIPGQTTKPDGVWRSRHGDLYYTESKFGKSSLTKPQRRAKRGLGDRYHVERWSYDFFDKVGGYSGGLLGGAFGSALDAGGSNCTCQ